MAFNFSFSSALSIWKPLSIFVLALFIYAMFVFKFYRFIGSRNIFYLGLHRYNTTAIDVLKNILTVVLYFVEFFLVFPIIIFVFGALITVLITFLSGSQDLANILLVSFSLVAVIRVSSYFEEDLARDLAKMVPFALLGVFLIDASSFSLTGSYEVLKQATTHLGTLAYYLLFVILIELFFRILHLIFTKGDDGDYYGD